MLISFISNAQDITNTLGAGGQLIVKDASTNFLTISQATGQVNILNSLRLENTDNTTTGVIFKGTNRFLHNYYNGVSYNTFLGINAGNFTLTTANENTGIGYLSLSDLTTGDYNTAVGRSALEFNTTGYSNTAMGYFSLSTNTTGVQNTALGDYSLFANTDGYENTAVGYLSLESNIEGYRNTAVGSESLNLNTYGRDNSAFGYQSLYNNTTGVVNSAFGRESLFSNTTGHSNSAYGSGTLYKNISGYENSAFGYNALFNNTTGYRNSTYGNGSLLHNTTGYENSAFGYYAGSTITTGVNLTCIGYNAEPTSASATNQITLGNSSVTSLRCAVTTITALSDARDKKNIKDLKLGIDFLMKLKPRQYNWDKREWYENNISDGSKMNKEPTAGFIAQELNEAQITANAEWLNLVLKDNPEKWEATPGNLLPIIVKAVQELKAENDELEIKNEKLKIEKDEEIAELKTRLSKYEEMQTMLVKELEQLKSDQQNFKVQIVKSEVGNQ